MNYSSFYGGRPGASFRIVKQFDGIDIPNTTYRRAYYAIETVGNEDYYKYPFIRKNADNYSQYSWKIVTLDGGSVEVIYDSGAIGKQNVGTEEAEGMVQCFSQGGLTTSIVNYGEYVIIDTIAGMQEYGHPDNGKIYRRGMEYDTSKDALAGAIYQGCIVGPKGDSSELMMDSLEDVIADGGKRREYTVDQGDLLPGKDGNTYNDKIFYSWMNYRNSEGELNQAAIGFAFPYLVQDFVTGIRSSYYVEGDDLPAGKNYGDILDSDFNVAERIDDKSHPFYEEWKFNIPKGTKGDTLSDIETYPTKAKAGAKMYNDSTLTDRAGTATGNENVILNNWNPDDDFLLLNNGKYISRADGIKRKMRYKKYNYDQNQDGIFTYDDVNIYDAFVEDVFIDTDSGGGEGSGTQKIGYQWNTSDRKVMIGQPINYILDSYVVPIDSEEIKLRSHLLLLYSDPERRSASSIKNKAFYSKRLNATVNGWTDMGNVRGEKGEINILGIYPTLEDVPSLPPEQIMGSVSDPDYNFAGWTVLIGDREDPTTLYRLAIYSYEEEQWNDVGLYLNNPNTIITTDMSGTTLSDGGFAIDISKTRAGNAIISYMNQKLDGEMIEHPLGAELRHVGTSRNSGNENFEEEFILGTDEDAEVTKEKTVYNDVECIKTVETRRYRVSESSANYYMLEKTTYEELKMDYKNNNKTLIVNLDPKVLYSESVLYYYNEDSEKNKIATKVDNFVYNDVTHTIVIRSSIAQE